MPPASRPPSPPRRCSRSRRRARPGWAARHRAHPSGGRSAPPDSRPRRRPRIAAGPWSRRESPRRGGSPRRHVATALPRRRRIARPCLLLLADAHQALCDGASETRTRDLLGAIQALSQLSYSPAGGVGHAVIGKSLDSRTVHLLIGPVLV